MISQQHMSNQPDTAEEPEQLRQEIDETRAELGETVHALAAKTDVKARARREVDERKARIGERKARARETAQRAVGNVRSRPLPVATAVVVLIGAAIPVIAVGRR